MRKLVRASAARGEVCLVTVFLTSTHASRLRQMPL
jgi:hypothetical protein